MGWFSATNTSTNASADGDACPAWSPTRRTRTALSSFLFATLFLFVLSFPQAQANPYPEVTLLGFTFRFDGKDYNPTTDESTWHYTVTGPMVSGPTYKDLSHWMLALCSSHLVIEATGDTWVFGSKPDPHHGLIGIKWDDGVDKMGSRSFYFVLSGDWGIDMNVAVAIKAGQGIDSGLLPGPACQPANSCQIDYDIKTRSDFRFLKPGDYAAILAHVDVQGDSPVRLVFSEFGDAAYMNPWASSPDIYFEYSIGVTLDDAELFGWYPAVSFNGKEVVVPKAVVVQGARVNVWVRAFVTEDNLSSEYSGGGRIAVVLLCD